MLPSGHLCFLRSDFSWLLDLNRNIMPETKKQTRFSAPNLFAVFDLIRADEGTRTPTPFGTRS
jgi:hypothetical protein